MYLIISNNTNFSVFPSCFQMTRFVLSDQTIPLFSSSGVGSVGGGGAAAGASSSPAFDRRESGFSSSNYGTVNSISGLSGGGRERRGNR